ncbi:hypothetical protein BAU15_00700 [Enterococcus sp. JM4C]|uniref:metallophosphoesterase family protein n=1 Tax=Candidatus Enterococcus huntleyi TaxID=1857217 RepID=UPI00137A3513|nr:metallophosphoesterase family protein [Enterococcus sp. JM4C]KAF1299198.1 hypothetical protein BAU15_00700 [Enterococcus sp. JM4C]
MKQTIAIFSDIHGNVTAFEAAIADARAAWITDCWILGDVVMQGWGAAEIFALIDSLQPSVWVKGNWDDLFLMVHDKSEHIDPEDASDIYIAKLGLDLLERLTSENRMLLESRPLNQLKTVNGITFSISHNLPTTNSGRALLPTANQENFDQLFPDETLDVAVYGHVHHQMMRYSQSEQLVINPGAIGYPFCARENLWKAGRAHYALLTVDEDGSVAVDFRQIAYDIDEELARAKKAKLPYLELYEETLTKGLNRTHDRAFLSVVNKKYAYDQEVRAYLNS